MMPGSRFCLCTGGDVEVGSEEGEEEEVDWEGAELAIDQRRRDSIVDRLGS